jgi:hypothetical protein
MWAEIINTWIKVISVHSTQMKRGRNLLDTKNANVATMTAAPRLFGVDLRVAARGRAEDVPVGHR